MKLFIALLLLLSASPRALAKEIPAPTVARLVCGGEGRIGRCVVIHTYEFPKNVDKMIQENPEFKDAIEAEYSYDLKVNCYGHDEETGKILSHNSMDHNLDEGCLGDAKRIPEVNVNSCYNLWKYGPFFYKIPDLKYSMNKEIRCNNIVRRIVRKTGKLY